MRRLARFPGPESVDRIWSWRDL